MHFEQKACPALLADSRGVGQVFIAAGTAPGYWREITKRLWTMLFRASYASLLMDIELMQGEGRRLTDYDRFPPDRHYLVLPRKDLRPDAGGLFIFPNLRCRRFDDSGYDSRDRHN